MTTDYGFHISGELEKRMRRCRAPMRAAIRKRLDEIAASAGKGARRAKTPSGKAPPLRFYVYEGYRIAYQLDSKSREVVVLDLQLLPIE